MEFLLVVALWLFAITHVDTLVVLVAFCADDHYHLPEIVVGHYLGFGIGLAAAVGATVLATELLRESAHLLGTLPIAIGLWELRRCRTPDVSDDPVEAPDRLTRTAIVAAAGVGLSGENVVVFVPFFLTLTTIELAAVIGVYVVAALVPLLVALAIARRSRTIGLPTWISDRLVPGTLVVVGTYVLASGWFAG